MHIEGNVDKVLSHRFTNYVPLLIRGKLQELLAEVVTKRILKTVRNVLFMKSG
jgi:alcohol dehydrogenase YqhD (iron-dependent ADH family)